MKKDKTTFSFRIRPPFFGYLFLVLAALIFTQALRETLSAILFVFVLLLPLCDLFVLLIGLCCLRVKTGKKEQTLEKNAPADAAVTVFNPTPIPFPFLEAECVLPDEKMIRCHPCVISFSLSPFETCALSGHPAFRYRGRYEPGVLSLTLLGPLRLFSVKKKRKQLLNLRVLPDSLTSSVSGGLSQHTSETSGSTTHTLRSQNHYQEEISDIRPYQDGDSLRLVHWKLSSKTQDLMVRRYEEEKNDPCCLFCDLSVLSLPFVPDDFPDYAADAAVASSLALIRDALEKQGEVCVIYADMTKNEPYTVLRLQSEEGLLAVLDAFLYAPIPDPAYGLPYLIGKTAPDLLSMTPIPVTGRTDDATIRAVLRLTSGENGPRPVSSYLCDLSPVCPDEKGKKKLEDLQSDAASLLIREGVTLLPHHAKGGASVS